MLVDGGHLRGDEPIGVAAETYVTAPRSQSCTTRYGGPLVRLKHRSEFLAVRGGRRWSGPAFLIEAKAASIMVASDKTPSTARFGFTVTKKLGGAIVRNRIRRRLSHALRAARLEVSPSPLDYVVVARGAAIDRPYVELVADFCRALSHIATSSAEPNRGRDRRPRSPPSPT